MSTPIEDYAIIGDTRTVAAVARNGSIDWWCVPRIDSGAVFAALLGEPEARPLAHRAEGRRVTATRRSYAGDSLVLETEFETGDGTVKVIDFMSPGVEHPTIFRIVEGLSGSVDDAPRAHRPLRLRLDRAVGAGDRRRAHAGRGQRRTALPQPGAARGRAT